jgi:hypothetical protein
VVTIWARLEGGDQGARREGFGFDDTWTSSLPFYLTRDFTSS